jgi:hypothetical protein
LLDHPAVGGTEAKMSAATDKRVEILGNAQAALMRDWRDGSAMTEGAGDDHAISE